MQVLSVILENECIAVESAILDKDILVVPVEDSCDYSNIKKADCTKVAVETENLGEVVPIEDSCDYSNIKEADCTKVADETKNLGEVVPIEDSCDYSNIKESDCTKVAVENENLGKELSVKSTENISQKESDSAMESDNVNMIKVLLIIV